MKKPKNSPESVYGAWHSGRFGRETPLSEPQTVGVLVELLHRYRNGLFMSFILLSLFFLLSIESVFNGGFGFSVRFLWFPWALLIICFVGWYYSYLVRQTGSRWKPWVAAVLTYPIALLMSWPYVMALNAFTGGGETVTYQGPIIEKRISAGRHPEHLIAVMDQKTASLVTLRCSAAGYHQLSEGEVIRETFFVGGLGIPYRWKFGLGLPPIDRAR